MSHSGAINGIIVAAQEHHFKRLERKQWNIWHNTQSSLGVVVLSSSFYVFSCILFVDFLINILDCLIVFTRRMNDTFAATWHDKCPMSPNLLICLTWGCSRVMTVLWPPPPYTQLRSLRGEPSSWPAPELKPFRAHRPWRWPALPPRSLELQSYSVRGNPETPHSNTSSREDRCSSKVGFNCFFFLVKLYAY